MGHLYYGNSAEPIDIPDRLLAHLRVVVATKLRRSESFTLSWRHLEDIPGGMSTIWLQPSIPLRFVLQSEAQVIDKEILERLATASNSARGLTVDLDMFDTHELVKSAIVRAA